MYIHTYIHTYVFQHVEIFPYDVLSLKIKTKMNINKARIIIFW
jgi:hypothetical protein